MGILAVSVIIFAVRYYAASPVFDASYAGTYINQTLTMEARVVRVGQSYSQELVVEAQSIEKFGGTYTLRGRIRTEVLNAEEYRFGDMVRLRGRLEFPKRTDPRLAAVIKNPNVSLIKTGSPWHVFRLMQSSRRFLESRFHRVFPEPAGSLAAGILLGSRAEIPKEILEDFRKTGLTHLLAISGMNVVIFVTFLSTIFSVFPKRISGIGVLAALFLFVILTGASASVVRAGIMGSLQLAAQAAGRKSAGLRALIITGFAMNLVDPFLLFYDIGFQLSFAATAGILLFNQFFLKRLERVPNFLQIRETLATTWSAQVFTTPLLMWYFHGISAISLLSNLAVIPFIPILMLGSFLSLFFGKITAAPTWLLFEVMLRIVHALAGLPFAFVEMGISYT